jgi:hypothetical protein
MTNDILVFYNNQILYPTPLVNYNQQPVTFGYVYGYNTDISLDGFYSGILTTGATISGLTSIFSGQQFKTLQVFDAGSSGTGVATGVGNLLYQWNNITIDSISLEPNPYFSGSFVKYGIKLKSFNFPSGVIDPSNEYAFSQNEDGTVNVNHKISARAVRDSNGAFQNAINFVNQFTGKDPFSNCLPYFVPSGSGVMLSLSESINRVDSIYSVTEVYKYNTGESVPYTQITSLDVDEALGSEYKSINYNLKFQGSPVTKTASSVINNYLNYNLLSDIQTEFGLNTSNWIKDTYSVNVDSGSAIIDIKVGFMSGANPSGFFDYEVSLDGDYLANQEIWKIDGNFRCFGPLDYKLKQIAAFKTANDTNSWRNYLTGIIVNSPIYSNLHNAGISFSPNYKINVDENLSTANLKLSLSMEGGYEPLGLSELKYTIEGTPSRWIYELMPSANIEGSFVVQDLQTMTQPRQKFGLTCKTYNKPNAINLLSGYLNSLVSIYINSGTKNNITAFLLDEQIVTGVYEVDYSKNWVGNDNLSTGVSGILGLQSIGTNYNSASTRTAGYNFGY